MALPPNHTITTQNNQLINYFELLVLWTNDILKVNGIQLNFKGYKETIDEYRKLNETNYEKAWQLARDLNAWSEYFSDTANLIQKLYLDADTDRIERTAAISSQCDEKVVANGYRLANQNQEVVAIRRRKNTLQAFYEELKAKVKFLERAHFHCKSTAAAKNRFSNIHMPQR